MDPNEQPNKDPYLRDALSRSQFHNSTIPGIIEVVGWHWFTPFLDFFGQTNSSGDSLSINYSFSKLSGG
jgi:hypothetical protein